MVRAAPPRIAAVGWQVRRKSPHLESVAVQQEGQETQPALARPVPGAHRRHGTNDARNLCLLGHFLVFAVVFFIFLCFQQNNLTICSD
jgi:hypothetical protein